MTGHLANLKKEPLKTTQRVVLLVNHKNSTDFENTPLGADCTKLLGFCNENNILLFGPKQTFANFVTRVILGLHVARKPVNLIKNNTKGKNELC